jgi:hypothetical protein
VNSFGCSKSLRPMKTSFTRKAQKSGRRNSETEEIGRVFP